MLTVMLLFLLPTINIDIDDNDEANSNDKDDISHRIHSIPPRFPMASKASKGANDSEEVDHEGSHDENNNPSEQGEGASVESAANRAKRLRIVAQGRRATENRVLSELTATLPLDPNVVEKQDKSSMLRLTLTYMRLREALDSDLGYSWDPETKRQSAEWRDFDEPRPEKVRRKQGALKVMHMIFFDMNGVILRWPVPIGTTINTQYYKKVLQDKLRPAIRKKRPGLLESGILFQHDNAPVHTARAVTDVLAGYKWELLEHPRYSPDLAPCDFHLFPKMKEHLRGQRFETEEDIIQATKLRLHTENEQPIYKVPTQNVKRTLNVSVISVRVKRGLDLGLDHVS
ncbi:hypothetical protein RRG08_025710 [Elysia crispata]|uniref:BHLH domain-containing protein n=1 Tax=Elysia crispata TaxID=231223 RepID=A0AAE1AH12_9GAST|nr:hypothetical protein RRG08_025710 [Elysia crispata]